MKKKPTKLSSFTELKEYMDESNRPKKIVIKCKNNKDHFGEWLAQQAFDKLNTK